MGCNGCKFLHLSEECKEHIIQRHFLPESNLPMDDRDSVFFGNLISPNELFDLVESLPRFQLEQQRWSGNCFIYSFRFGDDIGVHPNLLTFTNKIFIICACTCCPICGIHTPTKVITIYPA